MKVVLVAWVRVFRFWIPDTWGTGLAESRKVEAPNRSLTSIQHLVEGARDDPQLRIGRLANLHHQRQADDALRLVLRLGHVVVQLLVEPVDLDLKRGIYFKTIVNHYFSLNFASLAA